MGNPQNSRRGRYPVHVCRSSVFSKLRKVLLLDPHPSSFGLACQLPTAVAVVVTIATDRVSRYPLPWTCINFELDTDFPERWLVHRWRNARYSTCLNCLSSLLVMPHFKSFKLHIRIRHHAEPCAKSGTERSHTIEAQSLVRPMKICRFISKLFLYLFADIAEFRFVLSGPAPNMGVSTQVGKRRR